MTKLLADPDVNCNESVLGVTPLMVACANGHADIVQLLLDDGADSHVVDAEGDPNKPRFSESILRRIGGLPGCLQPDTRFGIATPTPFATR